MIPKFEKEACVPRKNVLSYRRLILPLCAWIVLNTMAYADQPTGATVAIPVKGMVTMVDIGAKECIPCKMMAPIMEQLEKEYQGKAAIVFIDVWKNPSEGRKFGIRAIPTQIFYDRSGNEVMRHEGFMEKKTIISQLEKLGVR
jgi:thioredoxin 1